MLAALCVTVTVACGCKADPATRQQPSSPAPAPRVVVLGIDAGTWDLLDGFIARGLLPNLAKLRSEGASGKLQSSEASSSPVIWTSIATGKTPEKHGITWFVRFPDGPGKPRAVDRTQRTSRTLWNILGDKGLDVAVVGWYVTWPAEQVNGRLVSDIAHYGDIDGESFPPYCLSTLAPVAESEAVAAMPAFMDFVYDPARATAGEAAQPSLDFLVYDRFVRSYSRDLFYVRATEALLNDGPLPEVLFLYLRGTDDVQHGFWKFMDPKPFGDVPPDQVEKFGKVIERYWSWIDARVGEILAHYKEPPLVLVMSDHGAGPAVGSAAVTEHRYLHLSGAHRSQGILLASGPGVRKGAVIEGASVYDVAPTLLHYLGYAVGDDMDGHALTGFFEPAIAERPVEHVATYETAAAPPPGSSATAAPRPGAAVDQKQLEHLRSLGYIE